MTLRGSYLHYYYYHSMCTCSCCVTAISAYSLYRLLVQATCMCAQRMHTVCALAWRLFTRLITVSSLVSQDLGFAFFQGVCMLQLCTQMGSLCMHCTAFAVASAARHCSRIMRKENYLIAMVNKGVLRTHLPLPSLPDMFGSSSSSSSTGGLGNTATAAAAARTTTTATTAITVSGAVEGGTQRLTKSLEWSIHFCVLNHMFNHKVLLL
jgi:Autophagy protein ATG9